MDVPRRSGRFAPERKMGKELMARLSGIRHFLSFGQFYSAKIPFIAMLGRQSTTFLQDTADSDCGFVEITSPMLLYITIYTPGLFVQSSFEMYATIFAITLHWH